MKISRPQILSKLKKMKLAAIELRNADTDLKNKVLLELRKSLKGTRFISAVLKANQSEIRLLKNAETAFYDRLLLNELRLSQAGESLRAVAKLDDPVGEEVEEKRLANGLRARRVGAPLGVILMIFESRPNVAFEAFSLAFKSGNPIILRGGHESFLTTKIIYELISKILVKNGFSQHCLWGITEPSRDLTNFLLKQKDYIDVVVPRGGEELIQFVSKNSLIPIIKHDRGLCHVYVDRSAKLKMAIEIVVNAKAQRPGVCNAMETVLVHESFATKFILALYKQLEPFNIEWHGCPKTFALLKKKKNVKRASVKDWDTEYLDFKMNCRIVRDLNQALDHIAKHGSKHSEAIVSESKESAKIFLNSVDAAAVLWNASTRFNDGFELGLGGELGISTQKLHVRGPVGLRELTTPRWVITGTGQIRN
jgi:glutamate-5-semialdehyde dehydrogenase